MKKEWFLIVVSVFLTLIIALSLVRWFAPQLLGLPVDLQMVRVAKEVPPFFDGVFRPEDYASQEYIIQDPYIKRGKPLMPISSGMGPNDILGFRNKYVPNIADIITIGDSQTYGNNVFLEQNWPNSMVENMKHQKTILYNMSAGAWGAVEYFEIFNKALYLQPKVVIVAFYTGNDPIDTFNKVYGDERWKALRLNSKLTSSDSPILQKDDEWQVIFHDGNEVVFTPNYRHVSNKRNHPAVLAGYEIMAKIAEKIGEVAYKNKIKLVFTIIPTKELAYKQKIILEKIKPNDDYTAQVNDEEKNLSTLAGKLQNIPGSVYVDLLGPIQQGVIESPYFYPHNRNGHPLADGYKLIGETLQKEVVKLLPNKLNGLFFVQNSFRDDKFPPFLIKNDLFYIVVSKKILEANGWSQENIRNVDIRDISKLSYGGNISTVNPSQFGPNTFEK